ncbi:MULTISPECIES: F390 synthetase-related protein [Providencia]|uniref:F390 synthetase-related protein n=2 Tax=Morganellaceae TaxID=1903414 RepID=UPI0018E4D3BA|nr:MULTISPECIES: F390 synthetase-related protein [Providencia]MBI6202413.1 CoF synthetase [Providencia rettgeri]MCG5281061.1 CoF synthetase [Providencia rettgeri]MDH2367558.1 CoF synthetase [Providencia rettgeri]HEM8179041.1 CoF synthetase [Providencia rettgeri]
MVILSMLWHYWRARHLTFRNRGELEAYQQKRLAHFKRKVLAKSPYFQRYINQTLSNFPIMNKQIMMDNFDEMNTAGLLSQTLLECAQKSEQSRDFAPKVGRYSVGLSSGTSGRRGLFVVSPEEQNVWSGSMLAKMLPQGLFNGERVALFLRANNNLYESVNNRWISLRFYDLFSDFDLQLSALEQYQPSIIVAPAQVLCTIADAISQQKIQLNVQKVISVAEVLEPHDKQKLQRCFPHVGEVYQATEGFLGCSCSHGTMHLNEAFVHIEPNWLDNDRFSPIITDFTRKTQPIVRYQLDDVLVVKNTPCPCGSPEMAIERIEGRCDDLLQLPGYNGKMVTIFADPCARVIVNHLPVTADFRLTQQGNALYLQAECSPTELSLCQQQLTRYFTNQHVDISQLDWQLSTATITQTLSVKKRRITRKEAK